MRGFWAVILFLFGLLLIYPGVFVSPLAILSVVMLSGAIATALWGNEERRRAVVQIFVWTCSFVIVLELGLQTFLRMMH